MIVGALSILGAVLFIILRAIDVDMDDVAAHELLYFILTGIGSIIAGLLYFGYGKKIRSGAIEAKIDILATFVKIVGICIIVTGIFNVIASVSEGEELGTALVAAIIAIILGLIVMFIASKINDGKQTIGDKLIWIILLIVFVICILLAILEIITIIGIISGICDLIIYSFMLLTLVDNDVKAEMGI